jgi:muramoyltetrapeptide carboxypeptidase
MTAERPPRIARGQTIGVVAPAGPIHTAKLERGLACLGDAFRVRIAPSLSAPRTPDGSIAALREGRWQPGYLAASDEVRAAEFNAMLRDPDVRGIVLARGGYGIMRILPALDADALRRDPKPIVGFSDATALLAWAYAAGVRGIHGPMLQRAPELPPSDIVHLVQLLTDPTPPGRRPWQLAAHGKGSYRGPVIAANLTLWSMLVGTPWTLPMRGALALIEEVGERPYEIDRYLTQLTLTGELAKPVAVIIGDLDKCEDTAEAPDASLATILERLRAAGTAAATGAPVGHGLRNEPIPFGAPAILDLDSATFEILEGAVL